MADDEDEHDGEADLGHADVLLSQLGTVLVVRVHARDERHHLIFKTKLPKLLCKGYAPSQLNSNESL